MEKESGFVQGDDEDIPDEALEELKHIAIAMENGSGPVTLDENSALSKFLLENGEPIENLPEDDPMRLEAEMLLSQEDDQES